MPSWPNKAQLLQGFILPALFLLLMPFCPVFSQEGGVRLRTVVIDAGHGGHDPGAISKQSKMSEKQINLDLALRLGERIQKECPDVKVIYTRKTDKFVELAERGNIANRNHADLFISIHVNSAKSTAASGTETFVMGTDKSESNMAVCQRENSVILLEQDYTTTYEGFDPDNPESYIIFNLMQNAHFEQSIAFASLVQQNFISNGPIKKSRGVRQAPLMVLWRTTMPSVRIEVGFLSNSSDRTTLNPAESRQKIANDIFDAFVSFKNTYDSDGSFSFDPAVLDNADDEPVNPPAPPAAVVGPHYEIQILASSKKLKNGAPELKGVQEYRVRFINGFYKYSVGNYPSKEEAARRLPGIQKKFPGAFVVKID